MLIRIKAMRLQSWLFVLALALALGCVGCNSKPEVEITPDLQGPGPTATGQDIPEGDQGGPQAVITEDDATTIEGDEEAVIDTGESAEGGGR